MKRTQLYLEEDVWAALKLRSRRSGTTISELVRQAVRERYIGPADKRAVAMEAFVGIGSGRKDEPDTQAYIRKLRKGSRLDARRP